MPKKEQQEKKINLDENDFSLTVSVLYTFFQKWTKNSALKTVRFYEGCAISNTLGMRQVCDLCNTSPPP